MDKSTILIIDDDINIIKSIKLTLKRYDYEVLSSDNPSKLDQMLSAHIDAVILDVYLGSANGKVLLLKIQEEYPGLPVIMISGLASIDEALECVRSGAFDFIQKPLLPNRLLVSLENAVKMKRIKQHVVGEILPVCLSHEMQNLVKVAEKVSRSSTPVLVTGESGTGKDLIARLIHSLSSSSNKKMVKINCGAIPENLVESELFGYKKGSFTGAERDNRGKIESASGSTLFLDEVGELPLSAQVKLLRFLENGEIQRVGESETISVKTRIVAATNKNLKDQVLKGEFREDLFYRLEVINFHIPPLRERREEIPSLVDFFATRFKGENGLPPYRFDKEAMVFLSHLEYPGNIRQLKNIVERTLLLYDGEDDIGADDILLQQEISQKAAHKDLFTETMILQEAKTLFERQYIQKQLEKFQYSIKETSEALGILPTNLCRRMRTLGIENKK